MACYFTGGGQRFPVSPEGYQEAIVAAKGSAKHRDVKLACDTGEVLLATCRRRGACSTARSTRWYKQDRTVDYLTRLRTGRGLELDRPIAGVMKKRKR